MDNTGVACSRLLSLLMLSRARFVAAAMVLVALLSVALVAEAIRASRRHEATASRVLTDFAALGAERVGARVQNGIANRFSGILNAVREDLGAPPAERLDAPQSRLIEAMLWTVRLDRDARPLSIAERPVWSEAVRSLVMAADSALPDAAYFGMLRQHDTIVVFSPLRFGPNPVAFAIPVSALVQLLNLQLNLAPVLPRSLTHDDSLDAGIGAVIRDSLGVLAARGPIDSARFTAVEPLGPMFGSLEVEVRIAESLAPSLVIGGLPRSRVPLLLGMLALTLLLAGAAAVQVGQERKLVRLREDVVAGASHELRTPLAQIRLFAETLRLGRVRTEEERERALAVIEREARRLEHLVDNLLHTSRAERGGIHLARESLDLAVLTQQIVEEFAPLASKSGVRIDVAAEPGAIVSVDPAAWRQVLMNLLDNAVKYGGRDAVVRVEVTTLSHAVVVLVSDAGPGVAPGDRHKVWQRFWRGQAALQSGTAGSGLGLATVRDLVSLHGGSSVVVEHDGAGATFRLELPR